MNMNTKGHYDLRSSLKHKKHQFLIQISNRWGKFFVAETATRSLTLSCEQGTILASLWRCKCNRLVSSGTPVQRAPANLGAPAHRRGGISTQHVVIVVPMISCFVWCWENWLVFRMSYIKLHNFQTMRNIVKYLTSS